MKRFLLFLAVLLILGACNNQFEDKQASRLGVANLPTLTADFDESTRTYIEDGLYLRWHEEDLITAFVGSTLNCQYKFLGGTGDNSGEFEPIASDNLGTGNVLDRIYAVYPYDATTKISDVGEVSYTIPAIQEYAENTFGRGANLMVAVTKDVNDKFLGFKNVCGYLKIKLYGDATIKSIELIGNGGEKLAGVATITPAYGEIPQIVMSDEATDSITLDCGDGITLSSDVNNPTEFWMVVPPVQFSEGFTIVVTSADGAIFEQKTSNVVTIERNTIQPMKVLPVMFEEVGGQPFDEIWYTSTYNTVVKPYDNTVFGANIISNTCVDGNGVIKFDGRVTMVGDKAFYSASDHLTSMTLPNSVTKIGESAFERCYNVKTITLSANVTEIGAKAFYYCQSMTDITIPDKVTTIGNSAFSDCRNLKSIVIPDSVTAIGNSAFKNCENLTDITFGRGLKTLGSSLFDGCGKLERLSGDVVSEDGRCVIIDGNLIVFFSKNVTEYVIPDGVTSIGTDVFYNCNKLTKVTMPNSLTHIGDSAFERCINLTSVDIPDGVVSIGERAFFECSKITSVTIPDSVTSLGAYAFYCCSGIKSASVGEGITIIGKSTFNDCSSLATITVGSNLTSIGDYAFYNCSKLTGLDIPDCVSEIGEYAFFYCTNLKDIELPEALTSVKKQCFTYCVNAFGDTLVIPDKVETIGWGAFYGVQTPKVLKLGKGLKSIGEHAFNTCCKIETLTIPSNVKEIGESAFENCYIIRELILEDGVESISKRAFYRLQQLTSVEIPSSVNMIGERAFYYCSALSSVNCKSNTPPSVSYASTWNAFSNNASNRKIYVPQGCVDAYKSASGWSEYADAITAESGEESLYESTDFSADGTVVTLQTASEGNGIDIVLMGDGYSDRLIADNTYANMMSKVADIFFSKEPFKTFRDRFNVYYVTAVSKHEGNISGNQTVFGCTFGSGSSVSGDVSKMMSYAQKAISSERVNEATIITIMNAHKVAGVCTLMTPKDTSTDYGCGTGVAILAQGDNEADFIELICHEAGGHGFAKLGDEYAYSSNGAVTSSALNIISAQSKYGWLKNLDTTGDESSVKWAHFMSDSRYSNAVGLYEGGYTYTSGVWRPTENSIMNNGGTEFNAPSREAIYYRIHKLAYGDSWVYDFEEFATYDAINLINATQTRKTSRSYYPSTPPVVID